MSKDHISTGRRGWKEAYAPGFKPRNKTLCLMASEDEAAQIDEAAKKAKLTRSAWLTRAAMKALKETHRRSDRGKGAQDSVP